MHLLNIGFNQFVSLSQIQAIVSPDASPIKRLVNDARDRGHLVDATKGRRTRSVIILNTGWIVLSAIQPETLAERIP
jgi:extracellular matrix regulatory protein A